MQRLFDAVARHACEQPEALAIATASARLSYAELWSRARQLASTLTAMGVLPNDRVALVLDNSCEYAVAYYGCLIAGAVVVPLNPASKARELAGCVAHARAKMVIGRTDHGELSEMAESFPDLLVLEACASDGAVEWRSARSGIYSKGLRPSSLPHAQELASIMYTSGTTGRPKGVMLSHANLVSNCAAVVESLALSAEERCLNLLPFFYAYGNSVLHSHLAVGASIFLEPSLVYLQRVLESLSRERITGLPLVPSTLSLLLRKADLSSSELSHLRYVSLAGGAPRLQDVAQLSQKLPHTGIYCMYGQTEATARLCCLPSAELRDKLGSAGKPIRGVEIEVRDETGVALGAGELGELYVRGPGVMLGYWEDPEATTRALHKGWLRTGDLGRIDAEGYVYIEARRADIIKTGEHRVNPREIEEVIAAMPGVESVTVVGRADELLGEVLRAVVVRAPGAELQELQVRRFCFEQLATHKVPREVVFVTALPTTASGKVMRHVLASA